jgi:mannose-6-phosphate isomerase-like protein (cupin superfamily)
VAPARYCRPTRLGPETFADVVDGGKVADAFRAGATVVLQSMHRTWPSISTMAAALEAEISHPVQVNAYLTPPFSVGLGSHRDGHDVFVVQTYGTKTWSVDGLGTFVLQPGDMLYLPAQTMHQAVATDQPSLHLTIGVLRLTLAAVLRRVLDDCDELAQPLPLGFAAQSASALAGTISAAVATAVDAFHQADSEQLARRVIDGRHPRRHHQGRLLAAIAVSQLDQSSRLRWRHPELARLEALPGVDSNDGGGGGGGTSDVILLHYAQGRLRLPPSTRCALERLMTGVDCTVGELPGLDPTSRVVLARRLIEESALELLPG